MTDTTTSNNGDSSELQLSAMTIGQPDFNVNSYLRGEVDHKGREVDQAQKAEVEGLSLTTGSAQPLTPPYDFNLLQDFADNSSTLSPCISAMEINVDSTGHEIYPVDDKEKDYEEDPEYLAVVELFREPYPNTTMVQLRKRIRRDLERIGNAYIEVIYNTAGDIVFLKYINGKYVRLIKYAAEDSVSANLKISRQGVTREMAVNRQERRYIYKKGSVTRYLAQMGATRDLDASTGTWAKKGNRLPANKRATGIIHLKAVEDGEGAYALPRWISQARSVAGEAEAESLNLSYFKNGGIPPIMIFLQNGRITDGSRKQLEAALSGKASDKQQGVIVETVSTTGSLDKAGNVSVRVERFGSDRQSDGMFAKYTDDCHTKVKSSYRMPQLFLGRTNDYNYATAYASIVVGEAQVFKPERDEFDAVINNVIVRTITDRFEFRSKPLVAVDVEIQKSILEMVSNKGAISNEELVEVANNLSNLNLQWNGSEPNQLLSILQSLNINAQGNQNPEAKEQEGGEEESETSLAQKAEIGIEHAKLDDLAERWSDTIKTRSSVKAEDVELLQAELRALTPFECNLLEYKLAQKMMPDVDPSQTIVALNAAACALNLEN
ncbi:gene transfer agent portal protein [Vibrio phage vB_VpS_PG28]|nr:gene transfer agent portal protein [Vibrio phage vB_VpS_PG28]